MYNKELIYKDEVNILVFEYSFTGDGLKLDNWSVYNDDDGEVFIPDREYAQEMENFIANWLEREYSRYALKYKSDHEDCVQEKRWSI